MMRVLPRAALAAALAVTAPCAALAQVQEPQLEIVVRNHLNIGVQGHVYFILPNNSEEYQTDTDDQGVAMLPFAECKRNYRVVVRPRDVHYFRSTDERCPQTAFQLVFQLQPRGGDASRNWGTRPSAANLGGAIAPVHGTVRPPPAMQINVSPQPALKM